MVRVGRAVRPAVLGAFVLTWSCGGQSDYEDPLTVPAVLDCTWDEDWDAFRVALQRNAQAGFPLDDDVFARADMQISRHLMTFLAFHRSKSNEFFHDCDRDEPHGVVCLYGMMSALFVHHVYLRYKIEVLKMGGREDEEVFGHSTSIARLMLVNKNNCLDFFDSSGWPYTRALLVRTLRPPDLEGDDAGDPDGLRPCATPWRRPVWPLSGTTERPGVPWEASGTRLIAYITGTHVALAREPAEMLRRFVGSLLGCEFVPVLEIADDQHCSIVGCGTSTASGAEGASDGASNGSAGSSQRSAQSFAPVGLRELAAAHFRPRWNGLDIIDFATMAATFEKLFSAHPLHREADLFVCTTPAILCSLLLSFNKPLLAYLGEPVLLSVSEADRDVWWERFEAMAMDAHHFVVCYNPFLAGMIEYQTGLTLPVIRLHGLYTEAVYAPTTSREVLVIKGPNICVDSACLLNRFFGGGARLGEGEGRATLEDGTERLGVFVGLDELGGAPYRVLAAFKATILFPYDVALAIFYEVYSMGMPLFIPRTEVLPFYVYRGLHSYREYHVVQPGPEGGSTPSGARLGRSPFIGALDFRQWFHAGPVWSSYTDFARFPHLLRFGPIAELLAALVPGATDWVAVSVAMRRFNEETLVLSAAQWAAGVAAAFGGRAGAIRTAEAGGTGYTPAGACDATAS